METFRDLLTSGDFPLGAKPWPVKEEDVIRLKANDTRMVRWMCIVRLDDILSAMELRVHSKLHAMWEFL